MKPKMKDSEEEEAVEEATSAPTKQSQAVVIRLNVKLLVGIIVLILVAVGLFFAKSLFVVAIVNGTSITRLAVIQELEKRSGKQALDAMITKKLVEDELAKKNITVSEEEVSAEIKKIEGQLAQQGGTLQAILDQQGVDLNELSEQIATQKKLEKMFSSTVTVSDEEVAAYIKEAKVTVPEGAEGAALTTQAKEQLRQQKVGGEINKWIEGLKTTASIKYLKTY